LFVNKTFGLSAVPPSLSVGLNAVTYPKHLIQLCLMEGYWVHSGVNAYLLL